MHTWAKHTQVFVHSILPSELQNPHMEKGGKLLCKVAVRLARCCLLSPGAGQALKEKEAAASFHCIIILMPNTHLQRDTAPHKAPGRYLHPPLLTLIIPNTPSEATAPAHSSCSYSR